MAAKKPSRRKVVTTCYLTQEQDAALWELSNETKVPVAEYIRRGVDLLLRDDRRDRMALSIAQRDGVGYSDAYAQACREVVA